MGSKRRSTTVASCDQEDFQNLRASIVSFVLSHPPSRDVMDEVDQIFSQNVSVSIKVFEASDSVLIPEQIREMATYRFTPLEQIGRAHV